MVWCVWVKRNSPPMSTNSGVWEVKTGTPSSASDSFHNTHTWRLETAHKLNIQTHKLVRSFQDAHLGLASARELIESVCNKPCLPQGRISSLGHKGPNRHHYLQAQGYQRGIGGSGQCSPSHQLQTQWDLLCLAEIPCCHILTSVRGGSSHWVSSLMLSFSYGKENTDTSLTPSKGWKSLFLTPLSPSQTQMGEEFPLLTTVTEE